MSVKTRALCLFCALLFLLLPLCSCTAKGVLSYGTERIDERLVRRMVRDYNFRGSDPLETMSLWANVRRGERNNISPFKNKANYQFDTSLPYEIPVINQVATQLFQTVPEGVERFEELRQVLPALQLFGNIDKELVAPDSLLREFIGGGIYEY